MFSKKVKKVYPLDDLINYKRVVCYPKYDYYPNNIGGELNPGNIAKFISYNNALPEKKWELASARFYEFMNLYGNNMKIVDMDFGTASDTSNYITVYFGDINDESYKTDLVSSDEPSHKSGLFVHPRHIKAKYTFYVNEYNAAYDFREPETPHIILMTSKSLNNRKYTFRDDDCYSKEECRKREGEYLYIIGAKKGKYFSNKHFKERCWKHLSDGTPSLGFGDTFADFAYFIYCVSQMYAGYLSYLTEDSSNANYLAIADSLYSDWKPVNTCRPAVPRIPSAVDIATNW